MVKIVVGNIYSKIMGFLPDSVHTDLYKTLSYRIPNAHHIPSVKKRQWDGIIRLYYKSRGQSFFTGLLSIVRDVLKKHNIEFEKIDNRIRPPQNYPELDFSPPSHFQSREYQNFTIDRSIKFTRGVLGAATGSGKTMMIVQIIGQIKTYPFIFYVLTKDLMEQAHDVLSTCLNVPIGKIGDGECDIKKISVCTIQTAVRALNFGNPKFKISDYQFDDEDKWDEKTIEDVEKNDKIKKLIKMANGIYMDEVHHAACQTVKDVMMASSNAYWRFGGSATPYRESGDDIMIQAMFGSKIVDISASYLIKNNYLVRPYIFFDPIDNNLDFHSWQKIYDNCVVKNEKLNNHVADTANYLVSKGLSTLILVQQYSHGDYLKNLIPNSEFVSGRMTSQKRKDSIQKLRNKEIMAMIATSLADEGLDIPNLNAVLLAGGGKSCTRLHQRIGRTLRKDRENIKDKSIVVIYDHYKTRFLKKHTAKIRTVLKKEKEFVLIDSRGPDSIKEEINKVLTNNNDRTVVLNF